MSTVESKYLKLKSIRIASYIITEDFMDSSKLFSSRLRQDVL